MLKINKILSKKIKFPLSLRGLFPFSHSRESGNPSPPVIAREQSDRSNLNLSGFSLIELMVAVVILALAIFGIFHAYSTGFMGMADARDRTVAVNYIQKTLEEYKNTPFNKIIDKPMHQITGTKFLSGSIVIDMKEEGEKTRLKKIITQVRWTDRNGDIKIEEASTLIYSTPKTGEILEPSKIVLYATPYYRMLPDTSTNLTAEIQDVNNNVITNWKGKIYFTIISGDSLGLLDNDFQYTINGTANNKFWSGSNAGSAVIQVSADLDNDETIDVTDTVEITISTGAVAIILEPQAGHEFLNVGETATINLYIVKADYNKNNPDIDYTGSINLFVSSEYGILSTELITIGEDDDGVAFFDVKSTGKPGNAEITASEIDLDMGYTEVIFGDIGKSIQLSAKDNQIYSGENTTITITILDENENPTPYTGNITIDGGTYGGGTDIFFENSPSEEINFSYHTAGEITVNASGGDLDGDSIVIEVLKSLDPSYIKLSTSEPRVYKHQSELSEIIATIYDINGNIVTNYKSKVNLDIISDFGYFQEGSKHEEITPNNGSTSPLGIDSNLIGEVNIRATSGVLTSDEITIKFYSTPCEMIISKNPITAIPANGSDSAEITVTIYGIDGDITEIYEYIINFSTNLGILSNKDVYPNNGVASTSISSEQSGSANINASESSSSTYGLPDVSINVEFETAEPTQLNLVNGSVFSWDKETIIDFNIEITGSPLQLDRMQILWPKWNLNEISIESPYNSNSWYTVFDNGSASPDSYIVDEINKTLDIGQSRIRLIFSKSLKNLNVQVIFIDNKEIEYPVSFIVPSS